MTLRAWDIERREIVGDYEIFRVRRQRAASPRTGREHTFHVLELPDWVMVVPLLVDGRVLLVEQYRHGAGSFSVEFPAGIIEPGESAIEAARRELEEETGHHAERLDVLATVHSDPAIHTNRLTVIAAHGCAPTGATRFDEREDLALRTVTPAGVSQMIRNGLIHHALAIAAWYFLAASHP